MTGGKYAEVPASVRSNFGDVEHRLLRVVEEIERDSALLTSMLDANSAQVAMRQNEDMRKISAWAAILAVPTMIAGIYGMNFDHMPELRWVFGYPLAVAVMIALCALIYWRFRRSGWL